MVTEKELYRLIDQTALAGTRVSYKKDTGGHIKEVSVKGAKGIGPHPMSPIAFAERAREWLADGARTYDFK